MGGMGGHGHGHGRRGEVDNSKFYELLGVSKTADASEIKKAFRKAAMTHHPDKGGDIEKFKEVSKAYEVLSDPEKRGIYDEMGEEGLEGGGGGGAADIFDLFGMGGGGPRRRGKQKGDDVPFPLKVSMEDMYNGATKKLRLTKNTVCKVCKGKGGSKVTQCTTCRGSGVRVALRPIGPGMVQQMQMPCNPCGGQGEIIAEKEKCKKCKGDKTLKEKKTLEVQIVKGMRKGQHIVFAGEADEEPNVETGDVVVIIEEKEHEHFTRKGDHLFIKKTITLVEALCGFEITIDHLDNRRLKIKSDANTVIKPGDFRIIKDEGMPQYRNPTQHGNLYIEFDVTFPAPGQLNAKAKAELRKLLPAPAPQPIAMDETKEGEEESEDEEGEGDAEAKIKKPKKRRVVEASLAGVDMTRERRLHEQQQREFLEEEAEQRRRERERDNGGGGGPQGVSCQQQ